MRAATLTEFVELAEDQERRTLGAAILDLVQAREAIALLEEQDFSLSTHRDIFSAIRSCCESGPVDYSLIGLELSRRGRLGARGFTYLSRLGEGFVLAVPMRRRGLILREFSSRRRLLKLSELLGGRATDLGTSVPSTLDYVVTECCDISQSLDRLSNVRVASKSALGELNA